MDKDLDQAIADISKELSEAFDVMAKAFIKFSHDFTTLNQKLKEKEANAQADHQV